MSSLPTVQVDSFHLTQNCPREIRDHIYGYIVTEPITWIIDANGSHFANSQHDFPTFMALLLVNKQIGTEFDEVLTKKFRLQCFIRISRATEFDIRKHPNWPNPPVRGLRLPEVLRHLLKWPKWLECVQHVTLDIEFDRTSLRHTSAKEQGFKELQLSFLTTCVRNNFPKLESSKLAYLVIVVHAGDFSWRHIQCLLPLLFKKVANIDLHEVGNVLTHAVDKARDDRRRARGMVTGRKNHTTHKRNFNRATARHQHLYGEVLPKPSFDTLSTYQYRARPDAQLVSQDRMGWQRVRKWETPKIKVPACCLG